MKLPILFSCIALFLLDSGLAASRRDVSTQLDSPLIGSGYSDDTQSLVAQRCFNAQVKSISGQQATIRLDSGMSYSDLERELGVSLSVSGSYDMFSGSAKASYLRSVKDKSYSMSLNYYELLSNQVNLQVEGYGVEALTESGKSFYMDGKSPKFGLVCGDRFVKSYQQSALLIMGINIEFRSAEEKEEFSAEVGASFGDLFSASTKVKNSVADKKYSGAVTIHAFQIGGEPSELSKVLSKDSSGTFYALSCTITNMDDCVKAAGGLLGYAKQDFSKQFSVTENKGLTSDGISLVKFAPIRYLKLNTSPSLVTSEVEKAREDLSCFLKQNVYYKEKLDSLLGGGYPAELGNEFQSQARSVLNKVKHNIAALMQRDKGAADCFKFPDNCIQIVGNIRKSLQIISEEDLKFLSPIQYAWTTLLGNVYPSSNQKNKFESFHKIQSISLNTERNEGEFNYYIESKTGDLEVTFNGDSYGCCPIDRFEGEYCKLTKGGKDCGRRYDFQTTSPFFFSINDIKCPA